MPVGKKVFGIETEFEVIRENWSTYELPDGTIIRVKHNLAKAYRLVDQKGNQLYGEDGAPQIYTHSDSETIEVKMDTDSGISVQEDSQISAHFDTGIAKGTLPDGKEIWYAIYPKTKRWVQIDPEQRWFWTEEWQSRERQAERDIATGDYQDFDDLDAFFDTP
jgi:hypothetical protein